jgi:hypothetical protein
LLVPATASLPSGCTTTSEAASIDDQSLRTVPPLPKVGSSVPADV